MEKQQIVLYREPVFYNDLKWNWWSSKFLFTLRGVDVRVRTSFRTLRGAPGFGSPLFSSPRDQMFPRRVTPAPQTPRQSSLSGNRRSYPVRVFVGLLRGGTGPGREFRPRVLVTETEEIWRPWFLCPNGNMPLSVLRGDFPLVRSLGCDTRTTEGSTMWCEGWKCEGSRLLF